MYSANRNDCVQFVLDKFGLAYKKSPLPNLWYHTHNTMIESVAKLVSTEQNFLITAFIFNCHKLQINDVVFMRFRGKFAHHVAIYIGDGHVEHCLPGRDICRDILRQRFFIFGVRLKWV